MSRSLGALVGIAQGLVCDSQLNDQEIRFLDNWLNENQAIASIWPGDVIHARIRQALSDGVVTDAERLYLIETLQELVGGPSETLAGREHVTELGFDEVERIDFPDQNFCLTGNFIYGPREACEEATSARGGILSTVTKKLRYLVVGSRGSIEWKHGSFGTKFEKAIQYKRAGCRILIVHEASWAASL
jgi:NAD-dependent DNA ligase